MKEIITVFRKKEAWGHMLLSAVVFFAIALPFRSLFNLLPGVTEIRPANMVPVVFGIPFGPAAAWGILLLFWAFLHCLFGTGPVWVR